MKRTYTHQPVIPKGYTGRSFNTWQKYLHTQLDKINGTTVVKKLSA